RPSSGLALTPAPLPWGEGYFNPIIIWRNIPCPSPLGRGYERIGGCPANRPLPLSPGERSLPARALGTTQYDISIEIAECRLDPRKASQTRSCHFEESEAI
ncbi:MAG: hypothetical protein ACPL7J_13280, partial [Desulfomonilaceae bacterium]